MTGWRRHTDRDTADGLRLSRHVAAREEEAEALATKKVMRLVDPRTGEMECRVCGATHFAMIRPNSNGHFYRGSWQCLHGCKLEPAKTTPAKRTA